MVITLLIFCILITIIVFGKINFNLRFREQVKNLFIHSKNISGKIFTGDQLIDLPEPVQKYFKHVLKDGQLYISYVRLMHDGQFKTGLDKDWVDIKGEQYFTTDTPGFIWKGTTKTFTARDMYIADKGRLLVSLFSLLNVVDGQGEQFDQGEMLRWLAESVWFPTNLLPHKNLQWTPVDSLSARLSFDYNGLSLFYIIRFNANGEIAEMETKRYMDKNLETWIIKLGNYEERNGIIIPTCAEALWRLEKGDFSYAKFKIKKIEYDVPQRF